MSYRRRYAPRPDAWLDVQYAGSCAQCGKPLPKGARAFYFRVSKRLICTEFTCARENNLTEQVWNGSPVSGSWGERLRAYSLGEPSAPAVRDPGEDAADRWTETH